MSSTETVASKMQIRVENVGGIDETEVELSPGVTALTGRNATNRTSFLQAVMAALGSDRSSLKGDADEGSVELRVGDDVYTRTLTRTNGTVVMGGDPYLDDAELADLFAFLLESNEARQAIARGDDLRELLMRPVDTESIQAEIDALERERTEIDATIEALDAIERRLPGLEEERTQLRSTIEAKREEREEKEAEIVAADADVDESREEKAELDGRLDELRNARSTLDDVRFDLETERESLSALTDELDALEDEYGELPDAPMGEYEERTGTIDQLRQRRQTLDASVNELQSLVQFNEEMLDGDHTVVASLADATDGSNSVTDRLVEDGDTVCWTCGSEVARERIESTVERLRGLREDALTERIEVRNELDELAAERRELERQQQRRDQLEARMRRVEREIDEREENVERLDERRDEWTERIESLEAEVEELEADEYSEILDLHREANQLEFELGRLQSRLDDVDGEIAEMEDRLDGREAHEARRDVIGDELAELRTRIERIEEEAITQFNEHMETILAQLEYENLERIWIERVERDVREGRRNVRKSVFDLHVVRSTGSGSTYEDTVDHLSESEREVTGLVFALAGYLVHDLHETVPVMLLDSLEAVDADRIATLVDYLEEYADYLVVALLPEDAAGLDDRHARVTSI